MTAGSTQQTLDPDRGLALAYVPSERRVALAALWELDARLGSVLRTGGDRMIARIKLAWWREALEALDRNPPPEEPLLSAAAEHLLPLRVSGEELAALEAGWSLLLDPEVNFDAYAAARGVRLFDLSARLLGGAKTDIEAAGEAWALTDLARHTSNMREAEAALSAAQQRLASLPVRWERRLRPLGMLAVLAARDAAGPLEPYGAPVRVLRMLWHRLTGR